MTLAEQRTLNDQSTPELDGAGQLTRLLGHSLPMPLREQDEALLAHGRAFRFGANESRHGWSFGEGPLVMLVHGYSGRCVQMVQIARSIAALGFECVIFDAGGHGASRAEKIGFFTFMNDVRNLNEHLDRPLHAMIGHSAGGLAMMRARDVYGVRAKMYGVISAPFYPYVPLNSMRASKAPEAAIQLTKVSLSDQFQTPWSTLVAGEAFLPEEEGRPLIAIYDRDDDRVQHSDAELIASLWPGTEVVKTSGYGHNRILQAAETLAALRGFMQRGRP